MSCSPVPPQLLVNEIVWLHPGRRHRDIRLKDGGGTSREELHEGGAGWLDVPDGAASGGVVVTVCDSLPSWTTIMLTDMNDFDGGWRWKMWVTIKSLVSSRDVFNRSLEHPTPMRRRLYPFKF